MVLEKVISFSVEVIDCKSGDFFSRIVDDYDLKKQIISMTAVEKTFKRSQLTMHKAEGCGALTLTEAGIVKQSVTQDTTAEGKALIE